MYKKVTICLVMVLTTPYICTKGWFAKAPQVEEEFTYKVYPTTTTLRVENQCGNTEIISAGDVHQVRITKRIIDKRAPEKQTKKTPVFSVSNKTALITTTGIDTKSGVETHYVIHAPSRLAVEVVHPMQGNVNIEGMQGTMHVQVCKGAVNIKDTHGKITALVTDKGSVDVRHARDSIHAKVNNGNITLTGTEKGVHAVTDYGTIKAVALKIPSTCTYDLQVAKKGNITLQVPDKKFNAHIKADAPKGQVTCDVPVHLDPLVTTLDIEAWSSFKTSVSGRAGSAEASMKLFAKNGSIKITQGKM